MTSLLDALLGAGDADVGAGVVGPGDGDLGGGLQLQLLQLLAVLANDKAMVLLGDGHCRGRLQEVEGATLAHSHAVVASVHLTLRPLRRPETLIRQNMKFLNNFVFLKLLFQCLK